MERKAGKRKHSTVFTCLLILCLAVIAICAVKIYQQFSAYQKGVRVYQEIQAYVSMPVTNNVAEQEDVKVAGNEETGFKKDDGNTAKFAAEFLPKVDFEALKAINRDIVGWIYLEGTTLNYPVVQGEDNTYYLDHLYNKTVNSAGSIFMDALCQPDFSDRNTVIYGHHMKNNTMFHSITNYKTQEYYDAHIPEMYLFTPNETYRVDVFAGFVTDTDFTAWQTEFSSAEAFVQWLRDLKGKSAFQCNIIPKETDHILTLSTCSYEFKNARYVLCGVLVPIPSATGEGE